jgi:hypothetical protein
MEKYATNRFSSHAIRINSRVAHTRSAGKIPT